MSYRRQCEANFSLTAKIVQDVLKHSRRTFYIPMQITFTSKAVPFEILAKFGLECAGHVLWEEYNLLYFWRFDCRYEFPLLVDLIYLKFSITLFLSEVSYFWLSFARSGKIIVLFMMVEVLNLSARKRKAKSLNFLERFKCFYPPQIAKLQEII